MEKSSFKDSRLFALEMDKQDILKSFRSEFYIADENTIYLDGNSLGRLPEKTRNLLDLQINFQWGVRLIRSWNEGWYRHSETLGNKIAQITGANENEVIVGDSTSMNLYKLAWAAVKSQKGKTRIISDDLNFPTDLYVLQGIVDQFGPDYSLSIVSSNDGLSMEMSALEAAIDENTALLVLSHVAFKSAFLYNMEKVTQLAHKYGALILWDLSHSGGAVPVELNASGADLAIGCTYKYLNGGPGSPAYLYVRSELQENLKSPVWGWFGDQDPFSFNLQFKPAKGIKKFLVGTPPVLSMQAIEPGLDIVIRAGIENIRRKSILQTEYLLFLYEKRLRSLGFSLGSPLDFQQRGSHVSIRHSEGYRICKTLIDGEDSLIKVIPDFREPDNIRIGIAPLYTSFVDIFQAVDRLEEITRDKLYESVSAKKESVT